MNQINLGYVDVVPANSSRYFSTAAIAKSQSTATINLATELEDLSVFNSEFNSKLIRYDSSYCTTVSSLTSSKVLPTLTYFKVEVLPYLKNNPLIIDIGCGQGEFANELSTDGFNVLGFDPALKVEAANLFARYWSSEEIPGDLYVMRCVLPHIENPWIFIEEIKNSSPNCFILIEFQMLDWILKNNIWYNISHDHVNLFSFEDFEKRYKVVNKGQFSTGEWGWVLIDPSAPPQTESLTKKQDLLPDSKRLSLQFQNLFSFKEINIRKMSNIESNIALWGAAGKGIVLAAALAKFRSDLIAIDADLNRQNKYLECSGVKVYSPENIFKNFDKQLTILVCNPNHLFEIDNYVQKKFVVKTPNVY